MSSEIIEYALSKLFLQFSDRNPSQANLIIYNRGITSEEIHTFLLRVEKSMNLLLL